MSAITDTGDAGNDAAQAVFGRVADGSGIVALKTECETIWSEIQETQQLLQQTQQVYSATRSLDQQPLVAILKEKEKRLKAEIEVLKNSTPRSLSTNSEVIEASLYEDLKQEVIQLQEIQSLVNAQCLDLKDSIEKETQFQQQLLAIQERLQEKCNSLVSTEPAEDAVEVVAQELTSKIDAARETEKLVMKRMAAFVSKHFPLPDQSQVALTSKHLRSHHKKTSLETLPLKDILLELMTKCVESPNDPYLVLDDRYWPAYVELLLRCHIILQHPDDDHRIKLVPFHL
ncbi:hypothetical protein C0Q70_13618 [Pomacea canaliculata]|uniref:Centromere protein K n=1 Tax=Pomacea canaliculata TaxID=400727 RepID=A0A2T7NXR4_POMCA|nr:centromere protein K-like [Pomacea canaliculata]PVD25952.1 hypothetical protein C0Q70_13618 [Pomacea canaliculata]